MTRHEPECVTLSGIDVPETGFRKENLSQELGSTVRNLNKDKFSYCAQCEWNASWHTFSLLRILNKIGIKMP